MERFTKIGLVGLALVLALAACSKSSETSTSTTATTESSAPAAAASAAASAAAPASAAASAAAPASAAVSAAAPAAQNGAAASDGAKVYMTNCSSCHQATGKGVEGTFPPLAGNPVVVGDATKVIHIVKAGLTGKIDVNGKSYNGVMPPWGTQLSAADIAAVLTYVRSSWGNKAGAVTEAQVKATK